MEIHGWTDPAVRPQLLEAQRPCALLPLLQLADACFRARRIDVLPAALEQRLRRAQLRGQIRLARTGGGACAGGGCGRGKGRGPRATGGRGRVVTELDGVVIARRRCGWGRVLLQLLVPTANADCAGAGVARASRRRGRQMKSQRMKTRPPTMATIASVTPTMSPTGLGAACRT
ncbi:hypothetical protein C8R44DRAFT_862237 [Mycena epipterygia]|nr:hypothetical protein C8R44DRAFT_862237 [Mycena epipterygia]